MQANLFIFCFCTIFKNSFFTSITKVLLRQTANPSTDFSCHLHSSYVMISNPPLWWKHAQTHRYIYKSIQTYSSLTCTHASLYPYAVVTVHESHTTKHRWDLERDIVVGCQEWYRLAAKSTVQPNCHCLQGLFVNPSYGRRRIRSDGWLRVFILD